MLGGLLAGARHYLATPARRELEAIRASGGSPKYDTVTDEIDTPFGHYRRSWFSPYLGEWFFNELVEVRFSPGADDAHVAHLGHLRSCRSVVLHGARVTDASAEVLARVRRLGTLDLTATRVTDVGVERLAEAADLEELILDHTAVTDRAVESLARPPMLKRLSLRGALVTDEGATRLRQARPDVEIDCVPAPSAKEQAIAAEIAACTASLLLRAIPIRAVRSVSGDSGYAVGLPWALLCSYSRDRPQQPGPLLVQLIDQLRRLSVVHLELHGLALDAKGCDTLLSLPGVEELYIEEGTLVDGMAQIARLQGLRKLTLVRTTVCDQIMEHIAALPNLEELHVRWPRFCSGRTADGGWDRHLASLSDDGLASLRRMPRLRRITLRGTCEFPGSVSARPTRPIGIGDAGLVHLAALPNLEYLDLSGTLVTATGLRRLCDAPQLRRLVLLGVPMTPEQQAELRRVLAGVAIETGELDRKESQSPTGFSLWAESLRDLEPIP